MVGFWQFSFAQCPPASPLATPYYENFDTVAAGQTGVYSNCWTATTTADPNWETESSGTGNSSSTGPLNDFSGTGNYVFMETSGGSLGDTSGLISPPIDLTGLTVPELTFYFHMYGATMGTLDVQIWNGSTWTSELMIVGQQQTSDVDPWSKGIVSLTSYSGSIQIKFLGTKGSSFTGDMSIDEVRVQEAPACPQPTGITISNIAGTSADVSWNSVAAASNGYEVIYGASGFNPATGGTSATTATTSYSISGLSGATDYDVYVISDCAASGISDTSGPVKFTTLCLPFTVGYSTNFDSDALDVPPLCWGSYVTHASAWVEVEDFTGTAAPRSAPQALYLYPFNGTAATDTLMAIGPHFSDLTMGDKQVHFWANSDGPATELIVGTVADQMSPETFVPMDTIPFPVADTYEEVIVPISIANGYNGTHEYVAFAHNHGATFQYIRIDDFSYENIPSCGQITGTAVTGTTDSSATFSFISSGTNIDVEWGTPGFTMGTGCMVTNVAAAGTFTISDGQAPGCALSLAAATTYEFYVRNNCTGSGNGVSPWAGPISFTTSPPGPTPLNCTVGNPSIIFSEEFDGVNGWTGDIGTSGGNWEIPGSPTSTGTGPNSEHSGPAGSFASFETSGASTTPGAIVSPAIDLSAGGSDAELSFWMHAYGATMGTLDVGVSTSPTGPFTTVFTWTGQFQTSGADPWVNVGADLSSYLGSIIYIELKQTHTGVSFTGDMAIDLIEVSTCLSCSNPSMLAASNITGTSADLAWTENGTATQWEISYGAQGFTPGSGLGALTTGNPFNVAGLTPATNYDWYVRAICGPGDTSGWVGPSSFFTLCAPIPAPYNQDFESGFNAGDVGQNINPCFNSVRSLNPRWEVEDASGFNENSSGTGPLWDNTFPTAAGGHYLYLETSGAGAGVTDTLTTPEIDVTSLTTPYLEFAYHMHGAAMGTLTVEVWDGSAWTQVTSFTGQQQSVQSDLWLISGNPIMGLTTDTIQFRFLGIAGTSFTSDMAIDDIAVYEAPSCFIPTNLGLETADDQTATIYWTTGGSTDWNVEYGPAGFTPGSGTMINATNDTTTLTGLSSATFYEFYVRDSCGPGDVSLWAGPFLFNTTPCSASSTCTYSADLFDSFGDGWNGAEVTVWQGGIPVATLGSGFTTGNNFLESFDVCDGLMTYVTLSAAGGFPSEVGIYVMDRAGDTVVSYPNSGLTAQGDTLGMFTVDCSKCPVFSAPFTETFEANSPSASCWQNEYVADSADWTLGMGAGGGLITMAHGGTQNAVFVSQSGGPDITRYVSPAVDISMLVAPELRFWYGQEVWFGDQNYLNVYYRTSDMSPWVLLWSDSTNQAGWVEAIVTLPMPSATYQLAFEGINNWGRANVLDDVTIMDAPACPAPTMLGVTNITNNSADIYWTGGGSATDWLVRYDDGTTATITASANDTITLTGLMAATGYTVHVKDSCGAGNVSVWAGPLTFNTAICAPANSCNYQALLTDAFGDGWNGAEVTVYQNGIAVQVLGTSFTTGTSFGPVSVPLCDGLVTHFVLTAGGGFPSEVGMDLDDPFGAFVATYAASGATVQGDTLITITSSCAAPACIPPANLGAFNITTNSADLFWTGSAGAMMYNVEYGPQGFPRGTGTSTTSANDTLMLTGINSSQCYDYYVQADCGMGDTSLWVGPFNFCTLCAAINTFPYTEGFSSAPATNLPACYADSATNANGAFNWYVDAGGTTSGATGPGADADGSATGNYVYTEASSPAATGDSAFLFLPEFDITSLTTPELVFYFHMYGADITTLTLEMFDAGTGSWMAIDSIVGQQQVSNIDPWQERRINLTAFSSSSLLLRFLHVRGASFNGDAALDNITIRETPLCVDPTALMITSVGQTSIGLAWTTDTNITGSAVQYGPQGFTLGSGTVVGSAAGMASVSGLMMNTCYDFYVLDSCGSATNWVGPISACTKPGCGVSGVPTNVMGDSTGCGGGGVTMTGTPSAGDQISWFVNGQIVGSGSPFIDTIGVTTNYEARNVSRDGSAYHLGPQPSIAAAGFGNFTNGQYITVMDTLIIDSTTVRSNGYVAGQIYITDGQSITDGGNILQRGEVFTTDSNNTVNTQVPVGIVLTPGQYFIGVDYLAGTVGSLFRATAGAVYPYVFPGLMSIDSVNFAGPRYYYTFDLVIQNACIATSGVGAVGFVPGANAGTSDSVTVCENNSAVDLTTFLGQYDTGGTWNDDDATGALTDSIFDASAVAAGGTYNFSYIVSQSGGCVGGDTATISVTVEASPFAGNDTTNAICITGTPLQLRALLPGSDNGGTMTDLDGSGALVGTLFLPGNVAAAGTYRFRYVVNGVACANDTATITMIVDDVVDAGMDASDTITDCTNLIDLNTYLSAGATAGGTWVDVSGSGALTGSTFDPNNVTNKASYDFRYVLNSACGDDSSTVSLYIDCIVGLNEYSVGNIDVYPNPTKGVVNIEALSNDNKIKSIEVYAINGELLIQRNADEAAIRIDLSGYADGLYSIKVTSERGVELHRINKK